MIEIVKWSETFETADTRKRQRLGWFLCPSGCDSKGFRKLMRTGKEGLEALGFFVALCQAMATLPLEIRRTNTFKNTNGSMMEMDDIFEISRIDGRQVADYRQITGRLVACGWIVEHNSLISQRSAGDVPPICQSSPSFVKGEGEGQGKVEGKEKGFPPTPEAKKPCTIEQAKGYAGMVNLTEAEAAYWWNTRDSGDWFKSSAGGGAPRRITSWQSDMAASAGWAREGAAKNGSRKQTKNNPYDEHPQLP